MLAFLIVIGVMGASLAYVEGTLKKWDDKMGSVTRTLPSGVLRSQEENKGER
jgi:hypothetical protein